MKADNDNSKQEILFNRLLKENKKHIDQVYSQLESFYWLQKSISIKGPLPPLRGWPVSPDFLLRLHTWIRKKRPKVIVELGSGATTIIIADALRQNGYGMLYSFEHLEKYAVLSREMIYEENLEKWVDLRLAPLVPWNNYHMNTKDSEKPSCWYDLDSKGISDIDLLVVDGPPESTCGFARFPAVPAFNDFFSSEIEVWMDDCNRADEKKICNYWSEKYDFDFNFIPLDKGLGCLKKLPEVGKNDNKSLIGNSFEFDSHDDISVG